MKKFLLSVALVCFSGMVCPDISARGMAEVPEKNSTDTNEVVQMPVQEYITVEKAMECFNACDVTNLVHILVELPVGIFTKDYIEKWMSLISANINDPAYIHVLNALLIPATVEHNMDVLDFILNSNPSTSFNDPFLETNPIIELLFSYADPRPGEDYITWKKCDVNEADPCTLALLKHIYELRPDTNFADTDLGNNVPVAIAYRCGFDNVFHWFLELSNSGKDIGLSTICREEEQTLLGYALDNEDYETVCLLIGHKNANGEYDVNVEHTCDRAPNALIQALLGYREQNIGREDFSELNKIVALILDSNRVDLNTLVEWLFFNGFPLLPEIKSMLYDMAIKYGLTDVLKALNIHSFWEAVENKDLNTIGSLIKSGNVDFNIVASVLSSPTEQIDSYMACFDSFFNQENFKYLYDIAKEYQLLQVQHAIDIHYLRLAFEEGDFSSFVKRLQQSRNISLDHIPELINSSKHRMDNAMYMQMLQLAQQANYPAIIQAMKQSDMNAFCRGIKFGGAYVIDLLRSQRITPNDVIIMLNSNSGILETDVYQILLQMLENDPVQLEAIKTAVVRSDISNLFQSLYADIILDELSKPARAATLDSLVELLKWNMELTIGSKLYVSLSEFAYKIQRNDILNAIKIADAHSFMRFLYFKNDSIAKGLMDSGRVTWNSILETFSNGVPLYLPKERYTRLVDLAQIHQRQDVVDAIKKMDERNFSLLFINNNDLQNMLEWLQYGFLILSQESYNQVCAIITDNQTRLMFDYLFLNSRFDLWGWCELPALLNSGQFNNLIRSLDQTIFNAMRNKVLQYQQQAIQCRNQETVNQLQWIIDRLDLLHQPLVMINEEKQRSDNVIRAM